MKTERIAYTMAALLIAFAGPASAETKTDGVMAAHHAYLSAINSNDVDRFAGVVTEDIVFIAPNSPVMEGKGEVMPWVGGYFDAVETSWNKHSIELVVSGNWAFERYVYTAVDAPRAGGAPVLDTGSGINIYRLENDGVWRVARDVWASSPLGTGASGALSGLSCIDTQGPC